MNVVNKLYAYGGVMAIGASQLLLAGKAYADIVPGEVQSLKPKAGNINSPNNFVGEFKRIAFFAINIILLIAGVLAVLFLLWSGLKYITSAGDPEKAKSARAGIINAVIGIVIVVAAFYIVRFAVSIGNTAVESIN